MSNLAPLEVRHAFFDKFRGAVVIPSGANQVAVSIEALEAWSNSKLSPEDAVDLAVDEQAMIRTIANATPAHDNVITITSNIMNGRSWSVAPYDPDAEENPPSYIDMVSGAHGRAQ